MARTETIEADIIAVHFGSNHPVFLELVRLGFNVTIRKSLNDDAEMTSQESAGFHTEIGTLLDLFKRTREYREVVKASKGGKQLLLFESLLDFSELWETDKIPPPVHRPVRHNGEPEPASAAVGDEQAQDDKTWPTEISDTWSFYCVCGKCKGPNSYLRVILAVIMDEGAFQMPIKLYATSDTLWDRLEHAALKITLSSERLEVLSSGNSLVLYNPAQPFKVIPQYLQLYQPTLEDKIMYLDLENSGSWTQPFNPSDLSQKLIRYWQSDRKWRSDEPWPFNLEGVFVGRCASGSGIHVPVPSSKSTSSSMSGLVSGFLQILRM